MPIKRFSVPNILLLLFLIVATAACSRKTVAPTATTTAPTRPTVTNAEPPKKPEVDLAKVDPDPNLSGRASAKSRQLVDRQKSGPTEVFVLRKTPCYGDCPVFRINIMSDGTVLYSGIRNVSLPGEYQSRVTPDWVDRLQRKAITEGIFAWSDTYPEDPDLFIADASNTITKFVWNGREKTITHNYDAPEPLVELEKELINLIDELKWSPRQNQDQR